MKKNKSLIALLCSLVFVFFMLFFTFKYEDVFWYLYSFTILVAMATSILTDKPSDQLPTWHYLIFGIGYGTVTYGIIRLGYWLISVIHSNWINSVNHFLKLYSPTNIWHLLLLILVISVGEELFWRGYVQQQLKQYVKPKVAVLLASLLCAISILLSGFFLGAIAAFIASMIFGLLYEWRKSMPLIIVAHVVFVLLLFLVLPLP